MPQITKGNKSTIGEQQYFLRTASWCGLVVLLLKAWHRAVPVLCHSIHHSD